MSPQFVDFDADGTLDMVAGIFDGSPHLARGTDKGHAPPEQILDRDGARIVMNAMWDFDSKPPKWVEQTRCDPEGGMLQRGHLTSAWAFDWDADGDLDLLLGDHDHGQVMLRRNEGKAGAPAFATRNEYVRVGEQPLVVKGTVTTLRTIDWDGDGLLDLLVGSMGDAYGGGEGGGVYVCRNAGAKGAPRFQPPTVLIEPSARGHKDAVRPDAGLYMDAADLDGDSDLDLVVGGYSTWTPEPPALDDMQKARVAELQKQIAGLDEESQRYFEALREATKGLDDEAYTKAYAEFQKGEAGTARSARQKRQQTLREELEPLVPGMKRQSFTWYYENLAK